MRLAAQHGVTLVEVLVASILSLLLIGASLTLLERSFNDASASDARNDTSQAARETVDTVARQLRNLASPTNTSGSTIRNAGAYDFTFQTADPARVWVRYCLSTSAPASPSAARLYQSTTTSSTPGSTTTCPGTGWTRTTSVVQSMTNTRGGRDRPVFRFVCLDGTTGCAANSSTYDQITRVDIDLWVDANGSARPRETEVATGVYLRNQNQAPTARFSAQPVAGQQRTYLLNGSSSSDPEGRTLRYFWFLNSVNSSVSCAALPPLPSSNYLGQGITLSVALSSGVQNVYLVVCDPGDRAGISNPLAVNVP